MVCTGRDLKVMQSQLSCHEQDLPLDQIAQSPLQAGLEHLLGWDTHSCFGQDLHDCLLIARIAIYV